MKEIQNYYTEEHLIGTYEDHGYTDMEFDNGKIIRVKTPAEAYQEDADEWKIIEILLNSIEF